jgi:hypothetical protein
MRRRRPIPPTHHLKTAIRKIDKIVWKLHDEQLAAYIAYVLAVSKGEKREIRKLFVAKFTAFGDLSAELERKLTPKERRSQKLLSGVLETCRELGGKPLKEIFLHCRSTLHRDEFDGFRAACPSGVKLNGIRVRKDFGGLRLFREGTRPVVRGTFLRASGKVGYLWASGFVPRLRTYPGWESPVPLKIDIQHGDADNEQVARDVLALTKLNYNACRFGDSEPVTIGFSNAVGEILVSNPTVTKRRPNFKFYI